MSFHSIALLSDLHGELPSVRPNDLTIIAGDICPDWRRNSAFNQAKWLDNEFREWAYHLPTRKIIAVWGNHDWVGLANIQPDLPVQFLRNEATEWEGLHIWGSPYSKQFGNWAFMHEEGPLNDIFQRIPSQLDLLVVHGPPFGACDDNAQGQPCGSHALREAVVRAKPQVVVCGHIHEARGHDRILHAGGASHVYNVSHLDESYSPYEEGHVMLFHEKEP